MLNKLVLMGRLTADPELKTTPNGVSVTSFTLAVDRNYRQGNERKTDFVNCVAWRGTAEFITRYFGKGQLMAIDAELQSRSYENAQGNKVTVWEAIVNNAYFAGGKNEGTPNNGDTPLTDYDTYPNDDDLPF